MKLTKEMLIDWIDRPPSNSDLDLINYIIGLQNSRDKAIEVINTQLKNAEGGLKDNLRIIKFNLIKDSCTFEDLKTEEDYKYILKGDSDE
ncbi:MAG: hypothetical protein IJV15_00060 [Lachnospiraceae bacterium]|nr:hypothetical protein [Lachnospiraceae bacterium]